MLKEDMVREILNARSVCQRLFDVVSGGAGVVDPWDPYSFASSDALPCFGLGCLSLGFFPDDVEPEVANLSVRDLLRSVVPEFDLEVVGYSRSRREVGVRYCSRRGRDLSVALRSRRAELVFSGVLLVAMDVEDPDVELLFPLDKPRMAPTRFGAFGSFRS